MMDQANNNTAGSDDDRKKSLPYSRWWPPLAGMVLGVILRLIFSGDIHSAFNAMNPSFILLVPLAVGAITVYVAEVSMRRSWAYYVVMPAFANLLFVTGTMAILIEGVICAVIIVPLFAFVGAVGGLLMGAVCRVTEWPRHAAYAFIAAPLVLGAVPVPEDPARHVAAMERTVIIAAPPAQIWNQLLDARDIRAAEVEQAWMYRIGVPVPLSGVTHRTPTALVREIVMGKSIHFEQVATEWAPNRFVRWQYRFTEDSFPPGALDDHVRIGGRYFDLIDTEYALAPRGSKSTALTIRMHYRVSTGFNWYARPVADLLIGNFEEVILNFYRARSIAAAS
jgi:hypothetical protein